MISRERTTARMDEQRTPEVGFRDRRVGVRRHVTMWIDGCEVGVYQFLPEEDQMASDLRSFIENHWHGQEYGL